MGINAKITYITNLGEDLENLQGVEFAGSWVVFTLEDDTTWAIPDHRVLSLKLVGEDESEDDNTTE